MVFSLHHHSKYIKSAGEVQCPYNQLGTIIKFIRENPDKRYNIIIPDDLTRVGLDKVIEQVDLIKPIIEDNYTIQCGNILQLKDLLSMNYNAYLRFPVSDWETFQNLRELQVSDIYIDGPLCFQSEAIMKGKGNTKIRVSPTISPNATITENRKPSSFFIRPEDLNLYSYIDVIDFKEKTQDQEDVLYQIYNRGSFNYDINLLIKGLPARNNLMFRKDFAERRINCGQKCNIPGYNCHYCETYFNIISRFKELATR